MRRDALWNRHDRFSHHGIHGKPTPKLRDLLVLARQRSYRSDIADATTSQRTHHVGRLAVHRHGCGSAYRLMSDGRICRRTLCGRNYKQRMEQTEPIRRRRYGGLRLDALNLQPIYPAPAIPAGAETFDLVGPAAHNPN